MSTSLALPATVKDICEQRDLTVTKLLEAARLIKEAQDHFSAAQREPLGNLLFSGHRQSLDYFCREGSTGKTMELIVKRIDYTIWKGLMDVAGIKRMMSASQYEAKIDQIYENPETVSIQAVNDIVKSLHENADYIFKQSVVDVFRSLHPAYKTNKPMCFGKKIILHSALSAWFCTWSTHGDYDKKLSDLHRILYVINGAKPRDYPANEMLQCLRSKGGEYKDEYLRLVGYQNGNVHAYISQNDADALNSILAGKYGSVIK